MLQHFNQGVQNTALRIQTHLENRSERKKESPQEQFSQSSKFSSILVFLLLKQNTSEW